MKSKPKTRTRSNRKFTSRGAGRIGRNSAYIFAACAGLWLPKSFSAVLVDLDATALPEGPLATWANQGTVEGDFVAPAEAVPSVQTVEGVKGVTFDGDSHYYTGPAAPLWVTDFGWRSIEAWIYNPEAANEETIFAWGRRSEPPGSNMSFNHGSNPVFGAVGHWGDPDIGWDGNMATGRWTYVVYTYDGASAVVYFDGEEANRQDNVFLATWAWDDTAEGLPLPFRVAAQNNSNGTANTDLLGSMTIAKIRVHDIPLDPATIQQTFEDESSAFGVSDVDGDGLPSWFENEYTFLDPANPDDAAMDQDSDGLSNVGEYEAGTDMENADTDADGISDGDEVNRSAGATDPLLADTDGDGFNDNVETSTGTFVDATDTGTDPLLADTDGDAFTDSQEAAFGSDPNEAASMPDAERAPVVSLSAADLTAGPLETWPNEGTLEGDFAAPEGAVPEVSNVFGVNAVSFNGASHYYTGPAAPSFLTGNASRSIEAWIRNPVAADEETIFSWGRRGGPPGSNFSFNHGLNPAYGAIGHWGAPDMGWADPANVKQGPWTHVAYTYDADTLTARAYVDGVEVNTETFTEALNTHTTDTEGNPLPFRVASQNEANGIPTGGLRGSMAISELRVYDRVLSPETIQETFQGGQDAYGLVDYDSDGLPTWYERAFAFLDEQSADASQDEDGDGLTNLDEFQGNTDPGAADTDGDGLNDGDEVTRGTNPFMADTDEDLLLDSVETGTFNFVDENDTGTDPFSPDSDFDGFTDVVEIHSGSDPNDFASMPTLETLVPLVNLDATDLSSGPLSVWPNEGLLEEPFVAEGEAQGTVETVAGVKGVTLDGVDDNYEGPAAPVFMTGNGSRTVEAWVFNPEVDAEESVVAWGRREGPDYTNASHTHGTHPTWGAIGGWGGGDVGWGDPTNIIAGEWVHLAWVYDAATLTATLFVNGELANTEVFTQELDIFAEDSAGNPLPFRVGIQSLANGTIGGQFGSMTIARVRVYDHPFTPEEISAQYAAEEEFFTSPPQALEISSISAEGGTVTISWSADAGAVTVEAAESLTNPEWTPVATGETDGSFSEEIPVGATTKFYRLVLE